MKILIVAYACVPNRGREEGIGWNFSLELAKLGHQIWVLTIPDSAAKCQSHPEAKTLSNLNFIPVAFQWLKNMGDSEGNKYLHQLRYFHWKKLVDKIAVDLDQEHEFDLIHHLTIASLQGGPALIDFPKPLVFGPVGGGQTAPLSFKKYFFNYWFDEILRSVILCKLSRLNIFLRKALNNTDLLLTTNQETLNLAKTLGAPRCQLFLDSALPLEYFPPAPPSRPESQELRLLWLGKIIPRKGLFLALEALSQVNSSIPFTLTVVGSGNLDKHLGEWIQNFKLEKKVKYVGLIPWTQVKQTYLNHDVFLFSSLRDSYGSVLLEAMSQALPIIALDHHGARDFVPEDAGIKIPVTHPEDTVSAFTRAIEYIYYNPEKRLAMGRAAYNFALEQSWQQRALQISQLYQDLVKNSKLKLASVSNKCI